MTEFPEFGSAEFDVLQHIIQNFNSIANLIPSKEVDANCSSTKHFFLFKNEFFGEMTNCYVYQQIESKTKKFVLINKKVIAVNHMKNLLISKRMERSTLAKKENKKTNLDVFFESSSIKTAQFNVMNSIKSNNWRYESAIFKD